MKRLKAAVQSGRRRARSLAARPPASVSETDERPLLDTSDAAPTPPLTPALAATPATASSSANTPRRARTLTRARAHRELPQDLAPRERKERAIQRELIETQDAMRANLDAVFARGEALELADTTTFEVQERAREFRGNATELRKVQFWRKWRVCIVLGVLILLAALAAVGCGVAYAVCGGTLDAARCRTPASTPSPVPTPVPASVA